MHNGSVMRRAKRASFQFMEVKKDEMTHISVCKGSRSQNLKITVRFTFFHLIIPAEGEMTSYSHILSIEEAFVVMYHGFSRHTLNTITLNTKCLKEANGLLCMDARFSHGLKCFKI